MSGIIAPAKAKVLLEPFVGFGFFDILHYTSRVIYYTHVIVIMSTAVEKKLQLILKEGASAPADAESELKMPDFFDERKFRLGQDIFRNNVFTMMVAKLSGLLTLLSIPSILDILIFTRQSGTPCTAFRRYASTVLHTFVWYEHEPTKPDSE